MAYQPVEAFAVAYVIDQNPCRCHIWPRQCTSSHSWTKDCKKILTSDRYDDSKTEPSVGPVGRYIRDLLYIEVKKQPSTAPLSFQSLVFVNLKQTIIVLATTVMWQGSRSMTVPSATIKAVREAPETLRATKPRTLSMALTEILPSTQGHETTAS